MKSDTGGRFTSVNVTLDWGGTGTWNTPMLVLGHNEDELDSVHASPNAGPVNIDFPLESLSGSSIELWAHLDSPQYAMVSASGTFTIVVS